MTETLPTPQAPFPTPPRGGKRAAVLRAARDLFLAHGFAGTSVDAVTRAAGVSKPTVYTHFPTKDALLEAVVRDAPGWPAPAGFPATGDPRHDLGLAAGVLGALAVSPDALAWDRLVAAEAGRRPDLGRLYFDAGPGRVLRLLADFLRTLDGQDGLVIDDPDRAAEFFLGVVAGVPLLRGRLGVGPAPDDQTDAGTRDVADRFLRAYSHRPAVPSTRPA